MKKSAVPAKRLARARIIELNGPAERVELLLLIFMAPLWGIVFPLIGLVSMNTYAGAILIGASVFCFLHFLHLNNSKFSFEEGGVRLPGVDHSLHPYDSLKRIYLENHSPLLLAIEFIPNFSRFGFKHPFDQPVIQLFETQHLTEESARQMWALFASHLRSCNISLDVRDKLVNWRTQASKVPLGRPMLADSSATERQAEARLGLSHESNLGHESQIARDLSMTIDLKPFDPLKLVGQYMVSYSDTFRKTWLTVWMCVAAGAYPITIFTFVTNLMRTNDMAQQAGAYSAPAQSAYDVIATSVGNNVNQLNTMSVDSLKTLFGNHLGAIGLAVLVAFAVSKFMRHLEDPDSMFVDYMGITTQKRTTTGVQPKEHRSWKGIDQIKLVRPHEKSNSSRWTVLFECNQDKRPVEIPFKAFSSDRIRQQFIECLDAWGRNIKTDPNLLEALAPRNQTSYTELWPSALSEAPKIDELTPHSVGLRLESKAYEIVSQLASGGQGVAYLAKRVPAEEEQIKKETEQKGEQEDDKQASTEVVLKETVLPIYVDDRARAKALARFERDAKLLASLDHPLIVRLEDFFVENNRAYLALEYIPGKTLKEKGEEDGPLGEEEVKRLALMMVDILEYLHERTPPVVHRDFTPDNLMLTNDGKIKLIDFDVALEQSSFSQSNATIVGKQAYIPLEQFRGKPCPQSDIYALGASLAYLLTGTEPAALESSHPRQLRPEISEQFDQIIAQTTAMELSDRVQSAQALRKLLLGESGATDMKINLVVAKENT